MARTTAAALAAAIKQDAGLERLIHLEEQLAPAPVNSRKHRALRAAIRIEAVAYRKSLDENQAAAARDRDTRNSGALRGSLIFGKVREHSTRPAGSGDGRRR